MSEKLLEVKNLRVSYHTYAGEVQSVRGVNFTVNKGETVAVVGESGCGKSVTAKSIMRLIKTPPAEIKEGSEIIFDGEDVLQFNEKRLCAYRGGEVAMVFQDALAALNPTMTVGNQIIENLRHHAKLSKKEEGPCRGAAADGGDPPAGEPGGPVPARVLGRNAPARDDRHCVCLRPQAAHRR